MRSVNLFASCEKVAGSNLMLTWNISCLMCRLKMSLFFSEVTLILGNAYIWCICLEGNMSSAQLIQHDTREVHIFSLNCFTGFYSANRRSFSHRPPSPAFYETSTRLYFSRQLAKDFCHSWHATRKQIFDNRVQYCNSLLVFHLTKILWDHYKLRTGLKKNQLSMRILNIFI